MAKETSGGTWINVNSNDEKGHVNIYGSDPREPHDGAKIDIRTREFTHCDVIWKYIRWWRYNRYSI